MLHRLVLAVLLVFMSTALYAKEVLVLFPVSVQEVEEDAAALYGGALQEGLASRYEVYYGPIVESELELEYQKLECDVDACAQNVALAFNGELIADASVTRIGNGYGVTLEIRNVITGKIEESRTEPCEGCNQFRVIALLKQMGRGESGPVGPVVSTGGGVVPQIQVSSVLILTSNPSGASVYLSDERVGVTPYQDLDRQPGESLSYVLRRDGFRDSPLTVTLSAGVNTVGPVVLERGRGQLLVSSEPYQEDAVVYINGEERGVVPLTLQLDAGTYSVRIASEDMAGEQMVSIDDGAFERLAIPVHSTVRSASSSSDVTVPQMVNIPAGSFNMGSADGDDDERPVHSVRIPAFRMMTHEVTVAQFDAFVSDTGYETDADRDTGGDNGCKTKGYTTNTESDDEFDYYDWASWRNPGIEQTEQDPVVCVSFNDALAYAEWLGDETGTSYRLPTEAEWEYAARAGNERDFFWGNSERKRCSNSNSADSTDWGEWEFNESNRDCSDGYYFTAPVAQFKPNNFGLYDMLGNVWEWVEDCSHTHYNDAPTDGSAWLEGSCEFRVMRGGSWDSSASNIRSGYRNWLAAHYRKYSLGFRLVEGEPSVEPVAAPEPDRSSSRNNDAANDDFSDFGRPADRGTSGSAGDDFSDFGRQGNRSSSDSSNSSGDEFSGFGRQGNRDNSGSSSSDSGDFSDFGRQGTR